VPTGSADNANNIIYWYDLCHDLPIEPYVLNVWVSSFYDPQSFEEILLGMDAIIVGGGNTLNMLAIWKAQGIDAALQKALQKGIILAGGSAGSICWFEKRNQRFPAQGIERGGEIILPEIQPLPALFGRRDPQKNVSG
jgi:dipeptidase E